MCLSMAMQATTHENALATPSRFLVDIVVHMCIAARLPFSESSIILFAFLIQQRVVREREKFKPIYYFGKSFPLICALSYHSIG